MESWWVFFLGVIALSSVVQVVFLVGLLVFGWNLAERLDMQRARHLVLVLGGTIDRIGEMLALFKGVRRGLEVFLASDQDAPLDRPPRPEKE